MSLKKKKKKKTKNKKFQLNKVILFAKLSNYRCNA